MGEVTPPTEPDAAPALPQGQRVTRQDWLDSAREVLISEGEGGVKVLAIGERLQVARSSFYWYFKDRQDLLDALLEDWERTNTAFLVRHCELPADTITGAVCNFFRCFIDPGLFDQRLDFAVREWARRDATVRREIDRADDTRLAAVAAMFRRHGYTDEEADIRARILYFQQLGYHALDQNEPIRLRMKRLAGYLYGFTGQWPRPDEVAALNAFALEKAGG